MLQHDIKQHTDTHYLRTHRIQANTDHNAVHQCPSYTDTVLLSCHTVVMYSHQHYNDTLHNASRSVDANDAQHIVHSECPGEGICIGRGY
jgi:hypothetical protein